MAEVKETLGIINKINKTTYDAFPVQQRPRPPIKLPPSIKPEEDPDFKSSLEKATEGKIIPIINLVLNEKDTVKIIKLSDSEKVKLNSIHNANIQFRIITKDYNILINDKGVPQNIFINDGATDLPRNANEYFDKIKKLIKEKLPK